MSNSQCCDPHAPCENHERFREVDMSFPGVPGRVGSSAFHDAMVLLVGEEMADKIFTLHIAAGVMTVGFPVREGRKGLFVAGPQGEEHPKVVGPVIAYCEIQVGDKAVYGWEEVGLEYAQRKYQEILGLKHQLGIPVKEPVFFTFEEPGRWHYDGRPLKKTHPGWTILSESLEWGDPSEFVSYGEYFLSEIGKLRYVENVQGRGD